MNDGGPAFPRPSSGASAYGAGCPKEGMTLRQWYAGNAMAAIIAKDSSLFIFEDFKPDRDTICKKAFLIADDMIAFEKNESAT